MTSENNDNGMNGTDRSREVYRGDFMLIRDHIQEDLSDERVAVQTGRPVEDARPTIVEARPLRDALDDYLSEVDDAE